MQMKVDRELEAAIQKHGETVIPTRYEEDWKEKLNLERQRIAAQQA
jgi:hypothetical protein